MDSIEEKRVYAGGDRPDVVYVASSTGLVEATVSGALVGEFSLHYRGPVRDVSVAGETLAIATDSDVLVGDALTNLTARTGERAFVETGFGPAVAVGIDSGIVASDSAVVADDSRIIAASPDGRVAQWDGDAWSEFEQVPDEVRAIDAPLLGAADGVYRLAGDELQHAGLEDVRDVAGSGALAATGSGQYALGNGWLSIREGEATVVAREATGHVGRPARANAVVDRTTFERSDGEWRARDGPDSIVDFGYGETTYAVTEDGRVHSLTDEGWRTSHLGVRDAIGMAVFVRP